MLHNKQKLPVNGKLLAVTKTNIAKCKHTLFPQLWFAFLNCRHDHVTATCGRKSVETTPDAMYRYYVQIFCTCFTTQVNIVSLTKTWQSYKHYTIDYWIPYTHFCSKMMARERSAVLYTQDEMDLMGHICTRAYDIYMYNPRFCPLASGRWSTWYITLQNLRAYIQRLDTNKTQC